MTSRFTAIVEQGRLRPTVPLALEEGVSVEVFIVAPDTALQDGSPALILAGIAALSSGPIDQAISARHDEILYAREAHP